MGGNTLKRRSQETCYMRGGTYMIKTCDSGSFPFVGDSAKFLQGTKSSSLNQRDESAEYFEKKVVENFLDKIQI